MVNPDAINRVYCTGTDPESTEGCGWDRILDPTLPYEGWHRHPDTKEKCYGQLAYEELEPAPEPDPLPIPLEGDTNGDS